MTCPRRVFAFFHSRASGPGHDLVISRLPCSGGTPVGEAHAMHPPLTLENHPLCRDVVIALKLCHRDNPWGRSFGACNEQKWALDACLKEQKKWKFRKNNAKAQAEKERLRARVEKYGHATVNGEFKK